VAKAVDIIRKELDVSMALTGVNHVRDIGRHTLI
jgi:isopentenyl diphosphate isomerase/L-lactate dehydrogenase-like FMN-dependent dehydrogenase